MTAQQITFPWAGETPRKQTYRCDLFALLSAYAAVQRRFAKKMAELAEADAQ